MYKVVYLLFFNNFNDNCHQVENQLQLINIISYHIISYTVHNHAISVEKFNGLLTLQA